MIFQFFIRSILHCCGSIWITTTRICRACHIAVRSNFKMRCIIHSILFHVGVADFLESKTSLTHQTAQEVMQLLISYASDRNLCSEKFIHARPECNFIVLWFLFHFLFIEIDQPVTRPPSHRSLRAVFPHRAPQYCSPRTSARIISNIR